MTEEHDNERCTTIRANLAAYALGDGELSTMDQAHLAQCAACRSALAGYRRITAALRLSAEEATPPVALRARILAAARQPQPAPASEPPPAPRRPVRYAALALAAALLIALFGWNITLQQRVEQQAAQFTNSRSNWHTLTALLNDADVRWYAMAGNQARGRFWADPTGTAACLVAQQLPPLADHQVYQVWLTADRQVVNGGTFLPRDGDGWVMIRSDAPFTSYQAVIVTIEAAGGSAMPSGPTVLQGTLAQAEIPDATLRAAVLRAITSE